MRRARWATEMAGEAEDALEQIRTGYDEIDAMWGDAFGDSWDLENMPLGWGAPMDVTVADVVAKGSR